MSKSDTRMAMYDEQTRHSAMIYVLMLVLAAAFAGFIWNVYVGRETPRIPAPVGAYKVEPPPEMANARDPAEDNAIVAEAPVAPGATPADEAPPRTTGAPQLAPAPSFVSNGPFVAQVAALQSHDAVQPAWDRLASRAPGLFGQARLDVERADLGQRGIYYRLRAGYFADRANAHRFCERVQQMGQDCIVVAR